MSGPIIRTHVTIEPGGTVHFSTPVWKSPSIFERFFGPAEPFYPEMVWPKPSPLTPHQTTYGTTDMPMTSDRETINDLTNRLHEAQAELAEATRALGESDIELHVAREELAMQKELTTMAGREAQRLHNVNTELQRQIANATPLGTYLIRSPGVYVATEEGSDHHLMIVKHLHRDAVVLTAHPDAEPAQWWQLYRDGLTGNLTAWHPPMGLHELIAATAKAWQDPSARPWGMDPGKGDDLTAAITAAAKDKTLERIEKLEQDVAGLRLGFVHPRELAGRVATLEQQMVAKLTEISHPSQQMFEKLRLHAERLERLEAACPPDCVPVHKDALHVDMAHYPTLTQRMARLEAWARQFNKGHFELAGVKPLDRMEPKA